LFNLAIYQKHIGNETNAQITLGKAEKLQRAILKTEEDQIAAAAAQISSPMGEDKRDDEEKERPAGDEKGLCSPMLLRSTTFSCFYLRRRSVEEF
jgi:hypothetical protein